MDTLIETIQAAIADDASDGAKAAGAAACRTILAALEPTHLEPSPPAAPVTPAAIAAAVTALRGVPAEQLLDLAITRLRAALPAGTEVPRNTALKLQLLPIPPGRRRT